MTDSTEYDCLIVGAGVTGTALLYTLARFTDLKRLCLVERCDSVAQVNSHPKNNSQTLHAGDIETHYSLAKAREERRAAALVVNYADKLPPRERDRILYKMPKMALGVGAAECAAIRRRFHAFKGLYPRMRLLERREIADLEPNVALIEGTWRPEEILATGTAEDYCAVDFQTLSESFSRSCVRLDRTEGRQVVQLYSTAVESVRRDGTGYAVRTDRGMLKARTVAVCAGMQSLPMAQGMGLGLDFACLPVSGSFYFAPEVLNGKVYRVHDPSLPFAAVHGDRDIRDRGKTRFGPTALALPLPERHRRSGAGRFGLDEGSDDDSSVKRRFDRQAVATLWDQVRIPEVRRYILRNALYEVPGLSRRLFMREVRKIVPSLAPGDIAQAEGVGGVRPQLVDKRTGRLLMGEAKIADRDRGLVFNMTPSPGGTSCLASAEADMRSLASYLGAHIDERALEQELLTGREDIRSLGAESDDPETEGSLLARAS